MDESRNLRTCVRCGQAKPTTNFDKRGGGRRPYCRMCVRRTGRTRGKPEIVCSVRGCDCPVRQPGPCPWHLPRFDRPDISPLAEARPGSPAALGLE